MTQASPEAPPGPPPAAPKASGLAVASLICGIAGVCTFGLGGLVGLILAIVARRKIRASAGQMGGQSVAAAGLIVSIITLVIGLILLAAIGGTVYFGVRKAGEFADKAQFTSHIKVLCMAATTYSAEHDGRLPPPDSWPDALMAEGLITDLDILTDPADPGAGRAIAMNRAVALAETYDVARAGDTVLLFECAPGSPLAGGRDLLPPAPRHTGGYVIGFLDGRIRQVPPERLDRLVWDPKAGQASAAPEAPPP